jgi:mono/diheme cytochrome c family protein
MDRLLGSLRELALVVALVGWLTPGVAFAGDVEKGKELFRGMGTCWTCHGQDGKGDGPAAAALNPKPADLSTAEFKFDANESGTPGEDEDLALVIKQGPAAFGGSNAMPPFAHLSDQQVADIVAFIRSLRE